MADALVPLAEWLIPFTVTGGPEALMTRRAVAEAMAASNLDAPVLVGAAHGRLPDDLAAVQAIVNAGDPSLVIAGSRPLVGVLAAAAVIVRLADSDRTDSALHGLLVQSAGFIGLVPAVSELPAAAANALADAGRRQRSRLEADETPREVARLLAASKVAAAAATDESNRSIVEAVLARDSALRALARRVEDVVGVMEERLQLLDEELDLLWWSRRGRPTGEDEPWEALDLATRAARAAADIASLLVKLPAPPNARSLLRSALAGDADTDAPLGDVAAALRLPDAARKMELAPLTTFRRILEEVGVEEREAAFRVFDRSAVGPRARDPRSLLDLAEQALRELQIAELL